MRRSIFCVLFMGVLLSAVLVGCKGKGGHETALKGEEKERKERAASAYSLNIRFNGLVAFVPLVDTGGKLTGLWALLPKADDPKRTGVPEFIPGGTIPLHNAFIRVKAKNVSNLGGTAGEVPIFIPLGLKDPSRSKHSEKQPLTDGYDIDFSPSLESPTQGVPIKFDDLSYIPELHGVSNEGELYKRKICKHCLDAINSVDKGRLIARLKLEKGYFKADEIIYEEDEQGHRTNINWSFGYYKDGSPFLYDRKPPQLIAQSVKASFSYPVGPLNIRLWSYKYLNSKPAFEFTLRPSGTETSIDIDIVNLPPGDALGMDTEILGSEKIDHFSLFYLLATDRDKGPYLFPMMDPGVASSGEAGGKPYCSVAQIGAGPGGT